MGWERELSSLLPFNPAVLRGLPQDDTQMFFGLSIGISTSKS